MQALLIVVKGRVQGIGFRASIKRMVDPLKITGYAKNLSCGDVEILAIGEKRHLDALTQLIHDKFQSSIQVLNVKEVHPQSIFKDFVIL